MVKRFQIYEVKQKDLCTPSEDYSARHGDWQSENCTVLEPRDKPFDTEKEAESTLAKTFAESAGWSGMKEAVYTILPVYTIK